MVLCLKARIHSRARQQGTIARSKSMKLSTMARYLSQIQEQEKVSLHKTGRRERDYTESCLLGWNWGS